MMRSDRFPSCLVQMTVSIIYWTKVIISLVTLLIDTTDLRSLVRENIVRFTGLNLVLLSVLEQISVLDGLLLLILLKLRLHFLTVNTLFINIFADFRN
jgi:hypothetical protein